MAPSFTSLLKDRQSLLLGTFISFNTSYAAQILARCGFDWLMIDMEHSPLSARDMTSMVHSIVAASDNTCAPIVRVPSHGVEWIKWALDSGASGIIVPMVNTREEAELVVKRGVYPPGGQRSFGPFHAPFADLDRKSSVSDYMPKAAKEVVVLPMIESVEAVRNAEEIMQLSGVDGVFIGPVDLRHSMGLHGPDGMEEQYLQALRRVLAIGKTSKKPVGILGLKENARRLKEMGFDYLMLAGGDAGILSDAATSFLEHAREMCDSSAG